MNNSRSLLDRLLSACFAVFIAAALIYTAVQLVEAVVWWLIGLAGAVVLGGLLTSFLRHRNQSW